MRVQLGDDVVYLREGHAAYLAATHDKRRPPWQEVMSRGRDSMRAAEHCGVAGLDYRMSEDGRALTVARITLTIADRNSPIKVRCLPSSAHPPPRPPQAQYTQRGSSVKTGTVRPGIWQRMGAEHHKPS